MSENRPQGLAIVCDTAGRITRVICDDFDLLSAMPPNPPLATVFADGSSEKAQSFWASLSRNKAAFDWSLNLVNKDAMMTLHFSGGGLNDVFLIGGTRSRSEIAPFLDHMVKAYAGQEPESSALTELLRINNEQTNVFRGLLKDQALLRQSNQQDADLYDEFSRLNNEMANLQRELAKKNAELARLNEQKNQFLGMVSHDLRNPLARILMYAEFLRKDTAELLNPTHASFLELIRTSSEFMLNLINDLLDIAQIESGKLSLNQARLDLVALARRNTEINQILAAGRQVQIRFESAIDRLEVNLDAEKTMQVLNNLIGNAIKFSPDGGEVLVRLSSDGNSAFVSVQDHGVGIQKADLERIFNPFVTIGQRSHAEGKGVGLGLAIARRIIAGHGGQMSVESEPGKGTIFTVQFPL